MRIIGFRDGIFGFGGRNLDFGARNLAFGARLLGFRAMFASMSLVLLSKGVNLNSSMLLQISMLIYKGTDAHVGFSQKHLSLKPEFQKCDSINHDYDICIDL